jgi:c-di-GMP-binding flagellar brake protein YcgR
LAESADSNGLRQHARLTQRLDIQFDGDELHATLEDISAGGLGVTVPDPLQIGQSLQAVISTFDEDYTLKLRARVVRQEPIKMGKTELYHAGLKFEHPSEELNQLTRELVRKMAVSGR